MSAYLLDMLESSAVGASLLLGLLGIGFSAFMPGMDRWNRRFFTCFFAVLVLDIVAAFAELVACSDPSSIQAGIAASYLDSLLPSVLVTMPTVYLLHCCGEDWRRSALFRGALALWAAYFALLGAAQFTTAFYYYAPEGRLAFGPWYPLLIAPLAAIMVLTLMGVVRRRERLSRKLFCAFIAFIAPLSAAALVQMATPAFPLVTLGITISAASMFAIVAVEHFEQHERLQQETARQRASIASLQMRPHFIHNTMTSIYYLCDQDPKLAKQVTMDFNTYLRKNFTAIAKEGPIPFEEELEHARAYLAVEQAQFASKLVIDFDTTHTGFRMPPLTLQPLVENAVKHGMTPETVPLHVTVRTCSTESGSEVAVEDDGPGFDPAIADDPRTTLANIRQRLEMMCGGTLEITPREGGGTVVRVTIPQQG
ncbi:MAG: histidine kinase [Eggerthellaceae bacterium]|nr:histidine kinase [Eggerthellaceae bacterium]